MSFCGPCFCLGAQASQVVASWGGHLAGILDLDICPATGRVATASEVSGLAWVSLGLYSLLVQ
jgi:hypothetical protein